MFDELRYRWALRKFLKEHRALSRDYEETSDDPESDDIILEKYGKGKELNYHTALLDGFRSDYLIEHAHRYHVPIPDKEDDWFQPRFAPKPYLTAAAAQKLRADIRAEQKADWDYWANRVTLALALIGSIFGVLAFFKK